MTSISTALHNNLNDAEGGGPLLMEEEESLLNNHQDGSSGLDYDDFPLEDDDAYEESKEDYFDTRQFHRQQSSATSNDPSNAWVQLLNLPPTATHNGVPVGGMRRVSSCYFSIASNISNSNNYDNNGDQFSSSHNTAAAFLSPNAASQHNTFYSHGSISHPNVGGGGAAYDALSFDGRQTSDFLLHDVLMNVFSFLDARSLAAFSETGRRPNFECFYFLELQLQRALLMGEGEGYDHLKRMMMMRQENEDGDDGFDENENGRIGGVVEGRVIAEGRDEHDGPEEEANQGAQANNEVGEDNDTNDHDINIMSNYEEADEYNKNMVPSFEGAIAGTGVISRLASLDSNSARTIVQTYLDSNASIHAMPLSHSLAYFRQVLLRQTRSDSGGAAARGLSSSPPPSFPQPNARNMALFFTFLGSAAYMHAQQGGGVVDATAAMNMPAMPDPSEVLNEENMEALKNMMLKVGLGGMFFRAGKTMKEKAEQQQQQSNNSGNISGGEGEIAAGNKDRGDVMREGSSPQVGGGEDVTGTNGDAEGAASASNGQTLGRASQNRSSSIGSIEDLSTIASRLYNAFSSNGNISTGSPNTSTANLDISPNQSDTDQEDQPESPPKRQHRSKRSHKALSSLVKNGAGESNAEPSTYQEEKESSEPYEQASQEHKATAQEAEHSPEEIAYAMEHPFSHNPYDHPSSFLSSTDNLNADGKGCSFNGNKVAATIPSENTSSFFSFNMKPQDPSNIMSTGSNVVPTGCIGAYAHAVQSAASEVTRLIKAERKANYDALPLNDQHELGVRFIDACTSDDTLHIVKDILQKQNKMDVDRFFIGPDATETCALHAAAFNGAEKVLQFLCGGIDERAPNQDCGLCDVNVRDANGWTALHFAAGSNSVTSVRVLSEHGAKLTIEASNGYTPFHWAERLSNEEAAAELERLGADNRFVSGWMFGNRGSGSGSGSTVGDDRKIPFVSFLANRFFAFGGR